MRQCIDLTQFAKFHQDSINLIRTDLLHNRPVVCGITYYLSFQLIYLPFQERAVSRYEQAANGKLEEYERKTSRQKYSAQPKYRGYREDIWVCTLLTMRSLISELRRLQGVTHESAMPPITRFIPRGLYKALLWFVCHTKKQPLNPERGDEDEDSDMEIGGMTANLKCPLLQTYLEEPMTSYVLCSIIRDQWVSLEH
jgi:hypothetical protein